MVDEFYLDLVALRELYSLLLKSCLRDAISELLDERAQILLKHLLDDATARVLEFHSKNLVTDSWISYNFLHKDDKQIKPLDEKVWMEHNQTARKMVNPEKIEHNPKRDRASSNIAANDLSNGISSALRRIELHILSLQRFTSQSRNTRSHISETKLAWNETLNQQKVQSRKDHSTSRTRFVELSKGHNLVGGQKVKPIVTSHCSEFVHGFRIPLSQDNDEAMKPPTIETHISKQHKLVNLPTSTDKSRLSVGSKVTARFATKLNQTRIQEIKRQNSYGHMVMRPTLLDHPSREVRMATQQESKFTNTESESVSSSSWATQQTNESETTDDSVSPPSVTGSDTSSRYRSSSSSSISSKAFKFSHGRKESKRAVGRFTRLKNKLGLIFHHHHHHHHHHHNSHNFMWKQLRKIFHRTDSKRVTTSKEERHGKLKKTAIRNVSRKNQVGKFLSHVWKSKAMKKKKKDVRVMNSGKKGAKKLHWWKVFRRRRGVKMPSKGRVKIGYGNRKPQGKRV